MFLKKLKAISYVEVVLTLVIVGVISALAIPSLKRYSQKTELGVLAKKAYLTLNEAMDMSIIENGPAYKWTYTSISDSFNKYIVPYLKVARKISTLEVLTKDNMKFSCNTATIGSKVILYVRVDVNNDKGPNELGKDIFVFSVNFTESKVTPNEENKKKLFENNWKFTDELWNK